MTSLYRIAEVEGLTQSQMAMNWGRPVPVQFITKGAGQVLLWPEDRFLLWCSTEVVTSVINLGVTSMQSSATGVEVRCCQGSTVSSQHPWPFLTRSRGWHAGVLPLTAKSQHPATTDSRKHLTTSKSSQPPSASYPVTNEWEVSVPRHPHCLPSSPPCQDWAKDPPWDFPLSLYFPKSLSCKPSPAENDLRQKPFYYSSELFVIFSYFQLLSWDYLLQ